MFFILKKYAWLFYCEGICFLYRNHIVLVFVQTEEKC